MMGIENWTAKERVARFGEYVEIVDKLLSNEETTFTGRFYKTDAAALRPRPVQTPRPPIIIAAMGPVMLGHAARHADIWNSISFAKTFEAQLDETRQRVATIDTKCRAIGRDPASLRRSYLMFDPTARSSGGVIKYYESEETCRQMIEQVIALGMTEIAFYYPMVESQVPMFERIARNLLPALKA